MATDQPPDNIVVAYPETDDCAIADTPVRDFLDYCRAVKPPGALGDRNHFDAFSLRPWLGYIMILEYLPDADDFLYRIYGTLIAEQSGFDMTGRRVSDFGSATGQFFETLYREAVGDRKLIYSEHTRVHARYNCDWHRLICPVRADDRIQVVVCNYPVQHPTSEDAAP